jgi:hypothetical protein
LLFVPVAFAACEGGTENEHRRGVTYLRTVAEKPGGLFNVSYLGQRAIAADTSVNIVLVSYFGWGLKSVVFLLNIFPFKHQI